MAKTYDLFISHSWTYSNQFDNFVRLLRERPYFSYRDHSVPKDSPIHTSGTDRELYDAIYNKMYNCHIVLILAGVYASYSKWIKKEIRIAKNEFTYPKPILAIKPWGQVNTSQTVRENCDEIVNWSSDSVVNAIRRLVP